MYYLTEEGRIFLREEEKARVVRGTHNRRWKARAIRNLRQFRQGEGRQGKLGPGEKSFIDQRVKDQQAAEKARAGQ